MTRQPSPTRTGGRARLGVPPTTARTSSDQRARHRPIPVRSLPDLWAAPTRGIPWCDCGLDHQLTEDDVTLAARDALGGCPAGSPTRRCSPSRRRFGGWSPCAGSSPCEWGTPHARSTARSRTTIRSLSALPSSRRSATVEQLPRGEARLTDPAGSRGIVRAVQPGATRMCFQWLGLESGNLGGGTE